LRPRATSGSSPIPRDTGTASSPTQGHTGRTRTSSRPLSGRRATSRPMRYRPRARAGSCR
jgi:hypothetical protein